MVDTIQVNVVREIKKMTVPNFVTVVTSGDGFASPETTESIPIKDLDEASFKSLVQAFVSDLCDKHSKKKLYVSTESGNFR